MNDPKEVKLVARRQIDGSCWGSDVGQSSWGIGRQGERGRSGRRGDMTGCCIVCRGGMCGCCGRGILNLVLTIVGNVVNLNCKKFRPVAGPRKV
jgi:hypothetical protein